MPGELADDAGDGRLAAEGDADVYTFRDAGVPLKASP